MDRKAVTVIIAAYNAANTIDLAIRSALNEPETGEVIVVDDCSGDSTSEAAERAGGGDPRLRIMRQEINQGPAAARNRAMDVATMPCVAILDADDKFLPGRFARIFATEGWDFCGDNIVFATDREEFGAMVAGPGEAMRMGMLDLETFLVGNLNSGRIDRSELGFLKPVIRLDFLNRHSLRYPADCRLGEDFLFYAKALSLNARFRIHEACGYAALERPDSLSGKHGIEELRRFLAGLEALSQDLPPSVEKVFRELHKTLRERIDHREVLDIRRSRGIAHGVLALGSRTSAVRDILRDKLRATSRLSADRRILIPPKDFDRIAA